MFGQACRTAASNAKKAQAAPQAVKTCTANATVASGTLAFRNGSFGFIVMDPSLLSARGRATNGGLAAILVSEI
jgi:hypothetical protein